MKVTPRQVFESPGASGVCAGGSKSCGGGQLGELVHDKIPSFEMCGYAAHPREWIGGAVFTEHLFVLRAYTEEDGIRVGEIYSQL